MVGMKKFNVVDVLVEVGYKEGVSAKSSKTRLLKGLVGNPKETFMVEEDVIRKVLGRIADGKGKFKDKGLEMLSDKTYKGFTKEFVVEEKPKRTTVAEYRAMVEERDVTIAILTAEIEKLKSEVKLAEDTGFNLAE
jgi:hypothetical protein